MLSEIILYDCPLTNTVVKKDLQPYLSFRDEITGTDGIAMKGRRRIIAAVLQDKALKQLQLNCKSIDRTKFLACIPYTG